MGRKDDLERHIRESHDIVRQYEEIERTSDRPEERARARRNIEGQWELIEGHLAEYRTICQRLGRPLAEDVLEIAAALEIGDLGAGPREQPVTPKVEAPVLSTIPVPQTDTPGDAVTLPEVMTEDEERQQQEVASLRTQLHAARENLLLIRERKSQYVIETDVPLNLIKRERQLERQFADLEAQLSTLERSTGDH
jgi:hypothetical protein